MPNPTPQQKEEFEGSFSYNVGVLLSMSRLYFEKGAQFAAPTGGDVPMYPAADALFEMILLRLRTFDSFFRSNASQGDDAVPAHWGASRPSALVLVNSERADISKRLAHLTYSQPPSHEWAIGAMVRRCCEAIDQFLGDLQPHVKLWEERHTETKEFLDEHASNGWEEIWTENNRHAHRRSTAAPPTSPASSHP